MQNRRPERSKSSFSDSFRDAGPYLTLGLELGVTMIVWAVIGYLLDRWLDTLPWFTLAGMAIGMVSLVMQLIRAARRPTDEKKTREKKP